MNDAKNHDEERAEIDRVFDFWFGELDEEGRADEAHRARWWKKDPAFDEEIREKFGALHARLAAGGGKAWLATPRGRLATLLVLDQFSRNMFRDTRKMFACDARAKDVALDGLAQGADRALPIDARAFFYLPLRHAETLALQDQCVDLFASMRDTLTGDARSAVAFNLKFAEAHRDIIRRFGRFPHRNTILGRATTEEEAEFLKQPGSSF